MSLETIIADLTRINAGLASGSILPRQAIRPTACNVHRFSRELEAKSMHRVGARMLEGYYGVVGERDYVRYTTARFLPFARELAIECDQARAREEDRLATWLDELTAALYMSLRWRWDSESNRVAREAYFLLYYDTPQWAEVRAEVLRRNPFCVRHPGEGSQVRARVAHHPKYDGWCMRAWEIQHCVSLCKPCHSIGHGVGPARLMATGKREVRVPGYRDRIKALARVIEEDLR